MKKRILKFLPKKNKKTKQKKYIYSTEKTKKFLIKQIKKKKFQMILKYFSHQKNYN